MIQQIVSAEEWKHVLTQEDYRALSPLIYAHTCCAFRENTHKMEILNNFEQIFILKNRSKNAESFIISVIVLFFMKSDYLYFL